MTESLAHPVPRPLPALLTDWLPTQRWFAGKGRPISRVETGAGTALAAEAAGLRVVHHLVTVHYADGDPQTYQVPLALRDGPLPGAERSLLGTAPEEGFVYDAAHDPAASALYLDLLRATGAGGPDRVGDLRLTAPGPLPAAEAGESAGMVIGVEQSNTSIVYGSEYILKLFRRLSPGQNPDLEVSRALHQRGCTAVIPPLGWISGPLAGTDTTLALLQPFLTSATEGWRLAVASVRDLYAEQDLHADEVGGDFAGESERLGTTTGEVHLLLADALPADVSTDTDLAAAGAGMTARLTEAVAAVPRLAAFAGAIAAAYRELAAHRGPVPVQRVHGDFHLGQVLRTDDGWVLIDFEGEPARPLAERTAAASPLRDVAGMLRSFDYAAQSVLADHPGQAGLAYRATEWAERNRGAFCDGYGAATGRDPREEPVLLRALEMDKAVYEVMYEARHRPSWLSIPLRSIQRLVG